MGKDTLPPSSGQRARAGMKSALFKPYTTHLGVNRKGPS